MVKLEKSEVIVDLTNIRSVQKEQGREHSNVGYKRWIELIYNDGNVVHIKYGRDDHYYTSNNPKLDADFKQLEQELIK